MGVNVNVRNLINHYNDLSEKNRLPESQVKTQKAQTTETKARRPPPQPKFILSNEKSSLMLSADNQMKKSSKFLSQETKAQLNKEDKTEQKEKHQDASKSKPKISAHRQNYSEVGSSSSNAKGYIKETDKADNPEQKERLPDASKPKPKISAHRQNYSEVGSSSSNAKGYIKDTDKDDKTPDNYIGLQEDAEIPDNYRGLQEDSEIPDNYRGLQEDAEIPDNYIGLQEDAENPDNYRGLQEDAENPDNYRGLQEDAENPDNYRGLQEDAETPDNYRGLKNDEDNQLVLKKGNEGDDQKELEKNEKSEKKETKKRASTLGALETNKLREHINQERTRQSSKTFSSSLEFDATIHKYNKKKGITVEKARSIEVKGELGAGYYKVTYDSNAKNIESERAISLFQDMSDTKMIEINRELAMHEHFQKAKDEGKDVSNICIGKPLLYKGELIGISAKKYNGGDGDKFLEKMHLKSQQPLSEAEQRLLEAQQRKFGLEVLKAAYQVNQQGIVHRDFKPNNFLVEVDKDGDITKVSATDFGKSVLKEDAAANSKEPLYITYRPIQKTFATEADEAEKNDSFSIGIILYQVFTSTPEKELPFAFEKFSSRRAFLKARKDLTDTEEKSKCDNWPNFDKIPEDVKPLIRSMLRDDVKKRITTSEAYAYYLDSNAKHTGVYL